MEVTQKNIEVAIKGKWLTVPALEVNGKDIVVGGKWLKIARIEAEQWLKTELENPQEYVELLKRQKAPGLRADILTFKQKLPAIEPKYQYPMEWDSVAAIPLTSFTSWWESLPQESRKNVRRAEKRGVVVQVKALDDGLVRDLYELNNDSAIRQGKTFTHYGKSLEQVKKDQEAFLDRCDYICAYHEKELIGVIKLIYQGDIASILTFLPKTSHHDKRPANAMMAKAVELNQILGARYLILASGGKMGMDACKKLCEQFTIASEQLRPHGLFAGFHNHAAEWAILDGNMRIMDFIAANTPPEFVLQLDVGTCVDAGADPVAWIKANPGRIKIAHLKDWAPGSRADAETGRGATARPVDHARRLGPGRGVPSARFLLSLVVGPSRSGGANVASLRRPLYYDSRTGRRKIWLGGRSRHGHLLANDP